jgi:hypothetical protein
VAAPWRAAATSAAVTSEDSSVATS